MRREAIGDCELWLGDCLEVLPTLGAVDAVVTDPPFGIGRDGKKRCTRHAGYESRGWDKERPSKEAFHLITSIAPHAIIWGGNYFADILPRSGGKWLVWDKNQRIDQSDCELAWTSLQGALRVFNLGRHVLNIDGAVHPTQKPVVLMAWCLTHLPPTVSTVCDPYLGSGTTLAACVGAGLRGVGIERDERYFDIACKRIEAAYAQPRLFTETPPKPEQAPLL